MGIASPAIVLASDGQNIGNPMEGDVKTEVSRLQHVPVDLSQEEEGSPDRIAKLFAQFNSDFSQLTEDECASMKALLVSFVDVFALDPGELGTTQLVMHQIDTGEHRPIKQPARRTPFALRKKIDELVEEMLSQGVIEPSGSPWASPIVLVQKKDGGVRFCVDYR